MVLDLMDSLSIMLCSMTHCPLIESEIIEPINMESNVTLTELIIESKEQQGKTSMHLFMYLVK